MTGTRAAASEPVRESTGALLLALGLLSTLGLLFPVPGAGRQASFPAPPPEGRFWLDEAGILREAEAAEVDRIAGALLAEQDVPLLVVALPSLAARGAAGYTIERYARELFDRWGIGSQEHNFGILLLVSHGDRAARIELGAGYGRAYDEASNRVMQDLILPEFRAGRFPEGVLAGVRGLDAMARGLAIPSAPTPWYLFPLLVGIFAVGGALVWSLFKSGNKGWAWAVLAALVALLLFLLRSGGQTRGGGGGGGGAFRGGSSGGGGATGRW
jgi:uncharacterized protein